MVFQEEVEGEVEDTEERQSEAPAVKEVPPGAPFREGESEKAAERHPEGAERVVELRRQEPEARGPIDTVGRSLSGEHLRKGVPEKGRQPVNVIKEESEAPPGDEECQKAPREPALAPKERRRGEHQGNRSEEERPGIRQERERDEGEAAKPLAALGKAGLDDGQEGERRRRAERSEDR